MKIILICAGGLSSSLLVSKMEQEIKDRQLSIDICAMGEPELPNHTEGLDIVLIAPQIRYLEKKIKKTLEPLGIKVAAIDGMAYGRMKGDDVLDQALALVE